MKYYLAFYFSLVLTGAGQQPSQTSPLPPGPLLNRAPEFSEWIITYISSPKTNSGSKKPEANQDDSRTTVTKTRTTYHVQSTDGGGNKTERWIVEGRQVLIIPNARLPLLSNDTSFAKSDFPGLQWLTKNNFVGVKSIGGADCLIFKDTVKTSGDSGMTLEEGKMPEKSEVEAAINLESRLPVYLKEGEAATAYTFGQPPSSMLTIPANLQVLLDQAQKRLRAASLIPPP